MTTYAFNQETLSLYPSTRTEYAYLDNPFPSPVQNLSQLKIDKYYTQIGIYIPSFVQDYSTYLETDTELIISASITEYVLNSDTWNELEGEEFKSYWYYSKLSSLSLENLESSTFIIYPNPTNSLLNVKSQKELNIRIYNNLGQFILQNDNSNSIDVSSLVKGVYFIKVSDGINSSTKKFIKN